MIESHGKKLYELVVDRNMIDKLKDLRKKTHAIRGNAISGGFNGILRALGAQMERESGINNEWDKITGPIAYEQARNINNWKGSVHRGLKRLNTSWTHLINI